MSHQQLGGLGSLPSTWWDSCALFHRWFSPSPCKLFCQKKSRVSVLEWVLFCIKDVALNGFRYREDLMLGFSHSQDKCLSYLVEGRGMRRWRGTRHLYFVQNPIKLVYLENIYRIEPLRQENRRNTSFTDPNKVEAWNRLWAAQTVKAEVPLRMPRSRI